MINDIINQYNNLKPDHGAQLSSHLPMTLFALDQLGASDAHIETYIERYLKKLDPIDPPKTSIDQNNWQEYLGQDQYYTDYQTFFLNEVETRGFDTVLRSFLPFLLKSPAAKAYHCMLRTTYGARSNNPKEIACGLAYWADSYKPLKTPDNLAFNDGETVGIELFQNVKKIYDKQVIKKVEANNIHSRFAKIANEWDMATYMVAANISEPKNLKEIAEISLCLYLNTKDFTLLHGMTSCHGLRLLLPFIKAEEQSEILLQYWYSLIVGYLSVGAPDIKPMNELFLGEPSAVAQIKENLANNLDDHDLKIAFTTIEEAKYYEDQRFLHAALLEHVG